MAKGPIYSLYVMWTATPKR